MMNSPLEGEKLSLTTEKDAAKSLWRRNWFPCIPKRYILAALTFLGFFNVYAMRVNLSMAIIVMVNDSTHITGSHQRYNWTPDEQGWLLSAFFCGYIITQIPGGWLSQRFGAKYIFGIGIVMTGVLTIITPFAADLSIWCLVAVRALEGLFEGVTYPANHALWSKWAPPSERARLVTFSYSGQFCGSVISFPLTALLCRYGFDGGWPSAFIIFGIVGVLWFGLWLLLGFSSPSTHPRISNSERIYIASSIAESDTLLISQHKVPVPWLQIITSPPLWAIIVAVCCYAFGYYLLLTTMPTYLKQVLDFDLTDDLVMNGVYSAIPYVFQAIVALSSGPIADLLRNRVLSTTNTRKLFTCSSCIISALFLILCAYAGDTKAKALVFLTIAIAAGGLVMAGYNVNIIDISPRYAGVLMGIANSAATIPGIVSPIIAKNIANADESEKDLLVEEWRTVFILTAEVYLFGAAIYAILADGNKQSWDEGDSKPKFPFLSTQFRKYTAKISYNVKFY